MFTVPLWKIAAKKNKYAVFKSLSVALQTTVITTAVARTLNGDNFVLLGAKLLSPEPIICLDCQGSELAQGSVAMLRGKNKPPVVMRARGLLGWRAKALRLD